MMVVTVLDGELGKLICDGGGGGGAVVVEATCTRLVTSTGGGLCAVDCERETSGRC